MSDSYKLFVITLNSYAEKYIAGFILEKRIGRSILYFLLPEIKEKTTKSIQRK